MSNIIIPFRANLLQSLVCNKFNCESLLFDGVEDYLFLDNPTDLQITSTLTFSVWVKTSSTDLSGLFFKGDSIALSDWYIRMKIDGTMEFSINNLAINVTSATSTNDGDWHHLMFVYVPSTSMTIFVDGIQDAQNITAIPAAINNNYGNITIGADIGTEFWTGNIDEPAIFNTDQTANISTLSTAPTVDISALLPIAWYRNGDNGSFKTPQWLIPSDENKAKFSNYSYEFQGINSRQIDVGTVNVGTTNITSMWLKRNVVSTQEVLLGGSSLSSPTYHMLLFTGNDFYVRYSPTVFVGWTQAAVKAVFNDTANWINIVVVRTGNTVTLHLNGDNVGIPSNLPVGGAAIGALGTQFTDIGAESNGTSPVNGIVNNIATWNVDSVLPSEIYNGGTPPDLTTLSTAPVNWWKMGEDATLVYAVNPNGAWNIPDSVGSNDGTTFTTSFIFARVGDAPNSTSNAVSLNMDFVDVVTDTP
tara:strand:+ start:5484 stop:6905 length:1422 start_codon:yes stop_codon:yes gene_type:complete